MMKALTGSSVNVIGRSSATVSAGPIPGSTPTAVPSVTPVNAQARCGGVRALAKPDWSAVSVPRRTPSPRQDSRRQLQLQYSREEHVRRDGHDEREQRVAGGMARVERT